MKHHKRTRGGSDCSGSGWNWQMQNLGTQNQQFNRVMDSSLGNPSTQGTNSINTISNVNANNNWMKGGRYRKGGNYGAIVGEALAPGILLAAQNMYRSKRTKSKRSKNNRRYKCSLIRKNKKGGTKKKIGKEISKEQEAFNEMARKANLPVNYQDFIQQDEYNKFMRQQNEEAKLTGPGWIAYVPKKK